MAAAELTQQIERIFGFDRLDINAAPDDRNLQVTIDGLSFSLDQVGSGLAHFIMVLTNVSMRRPAFLLLDEPEMGLHPTLLAGRLPHYRLLIRCSWNPLLDPQHRARSISLGSRLLGNTPPRRRYQYRCLRGHPTLGELLGELSYSGYQELGFDRVLMVEGPTDLTSIMQLLRLYKKEHEVVLLSLGGGSGIHGGVDIDLQEVRRITSKVSAIVDSEREFEGDELDDSHAGFVEACERNGVEACVLSLRALENYFPDHAVKAGVGEAHSALGPFERLRDAPNPWAKADNWRIARAMTLDDLAGSDLGEFLAGL